MRRVRSIRLKFLIKSHERRKKRKKGRGIRYENEGGEIDE